MEYTAYAVGDAVTIGTENFYVLKDSDETQEKVTLLAKDCIDTTNLVQSATAGTVAFSSTNYWSSETEYPLDLNDYQIPEGVTSVITTAKAYGTNLGGTGRLMTYDEATALQTANSDILSGSNKNFSFFLATACTSIDVYSILYSSDYGSSFNYDSYVYGPHSVRPVVEISKSLIS